MKVLIFFKKNMNKGFKIFAIIGGCIVGLFILLFVRAALFNNLSSTSSFGGDSGYSLEAPAATGLPNGSTMGFKSAAPSMNESVSVGKMRADVISPEPSPIDSSGGNAIDKKIIKNGNLNLKVDKVDDASGKISNIARQNGGEVFSSNIYQSGNSVKSGSLVVRVPINNFEQTFSEIKKVASFVNSESTSGQDVTEQYTDLQSQLKNKQNEEAAFTKILDQNTGKIEDILAVTRELSRVRGDIERLQGRIRFMDSQTDMSTITAYISEEITVGTATSWRPWQIVVSEVGRLVKDLQGVIAALIVIVVRLIPLLLVISIFGLIFWKIGKKVYVKFFKKEEGQN